MWSITVWINQEQLGGKNNLKKLGFGNEQLGVEPLQYVYDATFCNCQGGQS